MARRLSRAISCRVPLTGQHLPEEVSEPVNSSSAHLEQGFWLAVARDYTKVVGAPANEQAHYGLGDRAVRELTKEPWMTTNNPWFKSV